MLKSSRRVALILSGSALALAGSMLPAQAAATGWRVSASFAVHDGISIQTGVEAVSAKDAWEVGFSGRNKGSAAPQFNLRHWTGKAWRGVTLPARVARAWSGDDPILAQVGASSARNVWIVSGLSGAYLRLNGTRWSTGRLPGSGGKSGSLIAITAVKVFSTSDVWAVGAEDSFSTGDLTPYAAHYNGRKWAEVAVPVPASEGGVVTALAAVSPAHIWAVEQTQANTGTESGLPVVLNWTAATGWQDAATQPALTAGDNLSSMAAEPDGDIWVGGSAANRKKGTSPLASEWNGTTWSAPAVLGGASSADWQLVSMTPDGSGGLWAAGATSSLTITPSVAAAGSLATAGRVAPAGSLAAARAVASAGSAAAARSAEPERLWHLHGTTWSRTTPNFGKREWVLVALALVPRSHSVWAVGALSAGSNADGLIAIYGPTPR